MEVAKGTYSTRPARGWNHPSQPQRCAGHGILTQDHLRCRGTTTYALPPGDSREESGPAIM